MAKFGIKDMVGVIPAMITIFDKEENIDEKATRDFVEFLINKGVNGFYLTGSTGEGFLMTMEERKKVVETVIDQVAGRLPVIVHCNDIGTKKSIELAEHAYESGADAISSVPPFYWKFTNDQIVKYYSDVAKATPLPMIVYNIPLAGAMGLDVIKRLGEIENVKGIKYTLDSHHEIPMIKKMLGDDFIVYSGKDEMSLSGLSMGADGIIGSSYNVMPEIFIDIYNAVKNNDFQTAKTAQLYATHVIMTALNYDFFSVIRCGLRWMGVEGGYSRRPFNNMNAAEEERVKKELRTIRNEVGIKGIDFVKML